MAATLQTGVTLSASDIGAETEAEWIQTAGAFNLYANGYAVELFTVLPTSAALPNGFNAKIGDMGNVPGGFSPYLSAAFPTGTKWLLKLERVTSAVGPAFIYVVDK